jgi:hypothetical protein
MRLSWEHRGRKNVMRKPRHFQLSDALILTAATAVGIVDTRDLWDVLPNPVLWKLDQGWSVSATFDRLTIIAAVLLPLLAAWTVGVLLARLVPPRPSRRRVALQPGASACGAALLVLIVDTVSQAASLARFEWADGQLGLTWKTVGFLSWIHTRVLLTVAYPTSLAVLGAWGVLVLSGRARPEPSWVDRTGRALGVCWIVVAIVLWVAQHFFHGRLMQGLFR